MHTGGAIGVRAARASEHELVDVTNAGLGCERLAGSARARALAIGLDLDRQRCVDGGKSVLSSL